MRHAATEVASEWIVRWAHLVAPGARLLDVAAGSGRHARFFAARGVQVQAVDRDAAGLDSLRGLPGVTVQVADLEGAPWPFARASFDAIVVTNYLHRPLFGALAGSLHDDGVLLYETFMRGNERFGKPSNPDFLLAPDELAGTFAGLHVVAFEQGLRADRKAVIQRIVASRRPLAATPLAGPSADMN